MAPSNDEALIARSLIDEGLRRLALQGVVRRYRKGTVLIQEGDQGDTLFVILSGRLRAYGSDAAGREITYGVYMAGEYLGEMSLDGGPRSASVITLEPTVCAVVTRQTLQRHLVQYPEFAFALLAKVIRRARAATLSAKQLALNDVYGRLLALFNELSVPAADGTRTIPNRLTQQEIAARLGCSREMVSRLMKDLRLGGHVQECERGWVLNGPLPPRW